MTRLTTTRQYYNQNQINKQQCNWMNTKVEIQNGKNEEIQNRNKEEVEACFGMSLKLYFPVSGGFNSATSLQGHHSKNLWSAKSDMVDCYYYHTHTKSHIKNPLLNWCFEENQNLPFILHRANSLGETFAHSHSHVAVATPEIVWIWIDFVDSVTTVSQLMTGSTGFEIQKQNPT